MNTRLVFIGLVMLSALFSLRCQREDVEQRPFDIRILQMTQDLPKNYMASELLDDGFCCQSVLDYFENGYEFTVRINIDSELSEEITLMTNYFNHIASPASSFVSIKDNNIEYLCQNEFFYLRVMEPWIHLDLKEGVHVMKMRVKFNDCEIKNGYLTLRFPFGTIHPQVEVGKKYQYIYEWQTKSLFFLVNNGIIDPTPLEEYPEELFDRILSFYETHVGSSKVNNTKVYHN
jgi:hypothetical protein